MDLIDNGDLNIDNIAGKIQMIKALIETLNKTEGNNQKEIMKIQIRLNNYNNKWDHWMDQLTKS